MILTPKYLIFDRDRILSPQAKQLIKNIKIKPKLISYQAPWQNGVADGWILSARYEMLNHVLVLIEEYLRQLLREYVKYYNNDRYHLDLWQPQAHSPPVSKESKIIEEAIYDYSFFDYFPA